MSPEEASYLKVKLTLAREVESQSKKAGQSPRKHMAARAILFTCLIAGCTGNIELVGYGIRPEIQHGVKAELISKGPSGALIRVKNASTDILSINQSPLAMAVSVKRRTGEGLVAVEPCEHIMVHLQTSPQPDDFVIIAPGQTKSIPVPVTYKADQFRTLDQKYRIEKGNLYEVEVRLDPYFGTLTKETASKTLAVFMIPNYLCEPLTMNTMTIRAR